MMVFKTISLFDQTENSTFRAFNVFLGQFLLCSNIHIVSEYFETLKLILIPSFGTCFAIWSCSASICVSSKQNACLITASYLVGIQALEITSLYFCQQASQAFLSYPFRQCQYHTNLSHKASL